MVWVCFGHSLDEIRLTESETCGRKVSLMLITPASSCDWPLGLGFTLHVFYSRFIIAIIIIVLLL